MKVSVIIPGARLQQLPLCIDRLQESTDAELEIITVTDIPFAHDGTQNIVFAGTPTEKWNRGAAMAEHDLLVTGADDVWFQDGWLEASVRSLSQIDGDGLVAFNDLSPMAGQLATHYLVTRGYAVADWGGVLAIPAYQGAFMDNEATERAMRDGRFVYAEDAVIDHRHPQWDKAENDDIYDLGMTYYETGRETYQDRRERGFPNEWGQSFALTTETPGYGTVAVSARVNKHPERDFFWSWTNLMVAGLRPGDSVIQSPGRLASHLTANQIIQKFLFGKNDSLLLIDDDMVFEIDALEKLREGDRDVTMGFCTHRTFPPHAVLLHEMEEQPTLPLSLKGREYGTLADVDDNTIIPVDAVGFAFTLIRRPVLEAMVNQYGVTHTHDFVQWGHGTAGEDTYFSECAREKGFSLAVDTNVKIGHIGSVVYGWDNWSHWTGSRK